ncbi:hypothetical protein [Streptomyces sp. NPDC007984]|uniref:hypothetical protein n=1 Tax=Streptomyces sp. NPDC007984 TaxID=3364801 RepID=UPI0036ED7948
MDVRQQRGQGVMISAAEVSGFFVPCTRPAGTERQFREDGQGDAAVVPVDGLPMCGPA